MSTHYLVMAVVTVLAVPAAVIVRRRSSWAAALGVAMWAALAVYLPIELAVMSVAVDYAPSQQAVSVLGVTSCSADPLPEVGVPVCSPRHLTMNWTFALSGAAIAAGAVLLRDRFPQGAKGTAASALLAAAGLSYATSGFVPADVDLMWHTVLALPGMVAQVPAWIVIAADRRRSDRLMAAWTALAALAHLVGLAGFAASFVWDLPAGALQRLMVWALLVWAPVFAAAARRARVR